MSSKWVLSINSPYFSFACLHVASVVRVMRRMQKLTQALCDTFMKVPQSGDLSNLGGRVHDLRFGEPDERIGQPEVDCALWWVDYAGMERADGPCYRV
eukprot:COSAG04_NODE_112_length_25760_cov_5.835977_5_plen_98_part_00